jgi:hypothetical protein
MRDSCSFLATMEARGASCHQSCHQAGCEDSTNPFFVL